MRGRRLARLLAPLALMAVAASCGDEPERGGGLLLLVSRDGPLPLDRVDFTITSGDRVLHEASYRVPEEAALPTTFGVTSNGDATASVTITVTGWSEGEPVDRRDAIVTQVPTGRIALLRLVLSGRCTAQVELIGGEVVSACGEGNTCDPATGDCTSARIDGRALPSYQPDQQLGEGGGAGEPSDAARALGGAAGESASPMVMGDEAGESGASFGALGGASGATGAGGEPGTPRAVCQPGFDDCDDDPNDCETVIDGDVNNCGACGRRCPRANGHEYCQAGACKQTTCKAPLADCNFDPSDKCEVDTTRSEQHCLGCNQPCADATPFCTPAGCAAHRDITLVSSDTSQGFAWEDSDTFRRKLSLKHALKTPARDGDQGRVVVIGVAGDRARLDTASLLYAGAPMIPSLGAIQTGAQTEARTYYLMDKELPTDAGTYPVDLSVNTFDAGYVVLQVLELNNVRQVGAIAAGTAATHFCNPIDVSFNFTAAGSLTYAIVSTGDTQGRIGPGFEPFIMYSSPSSGTWTDMPLSGLGFPRNVSGAVYLSDVGATLSWASEVCQLDTAVASAISFARYGD